MVDEKKKNIGDTSNVAIVRSFFLFFRKKSTHSSCPLQHAMSTIKLLLFSTLLITLTNVINISSWLKKTKKVVGRQIKTLTTAVQTGIFALKESTHKSLCCLVE